MYKLKRYVATSVMASEPGSYLNTVGFYWDPIEKREVNFQLTSAKS
jgi:hypothetical protein